MAAGPWTFYNSFRRHIADGSIDLDSDAFHMGLFTGASNAANVALEIKGDISNEVANANGYLTDGMVMTGISWGPGDSAAEMRFTADATEWVAAGGDIANVKYAVIWKAGTTKYLVCFSELEPAQFSITSGNSLTVTPSTSGIFELK